MPLRKMSFHQRPTDPDIVNEEIKKWVMSAKQERKKFNIDKSLLYNYDFIEDKPIRNSYSRLLWDVNPIISFKSDSMRSSSASQNRSSYSTAVTLDYELMYADLADINPDSLQISPSLIDQPRLSHNLCLRERLGSFQLDNQPFKSIPRSKSF
jgi:hypothetical protein